MGVSSTAGFTLKIVIVVQDKVELVVLTWMTGVCLANDIGRESANGGKEALSVN